MKKFFYSVLAASMLFACSQEEIVDVNQSESQKVTFKVEVPGIATSRAAGGAIGAGTQADQLIYAMYEHGVENAPVLVSGVETDGEDNDGTFTVTVPMAKDIKYDLLFLAYNPASSAFEIASTPDSTNLKALKFNAGQTPNVDAYDAFVGFLANNGVNETKTVTLKRPFAQINAATSEQDLLDAATLGATVKQSKLVITGVPTTYNVLSEEATGSQEVTYATTDILNNETITVDGTTYTYLTLAYVLTNDAPSTHYATFEFFRKNDTNPVSTLEIPNLPIQRNYRTNVLGSLVTKQGNYTISIDANFDKPNKEIYLWDGKTLKEPDYNGTTNQYEIEYASEFAWLAAAVNGTLPEGRSAVEPQSFAGKTFVLTKDVDLGGNEWTPIGNSSNIFKGTFDGNGKTIKNLKITGYNSNVGLFGVTHDGEIKNFTVENAKVSGRLNVGVVAGQPYTSKYSNIKVQGHVEVNGMAYVGTVGGKNAYADWTNITVEADGTSYVKAHSIENETAYRTYVGGVVGFNGEGGHKFSNITSNINVKGSTCDVGGLFGIAHYGNQFNNCVCTGNVEIYAAEEADEAQEIGGIAGVWHNGGENVVFTDCLFTGNLSTNIEGINFYYDGLVGKPYAETGDGKLIITGHEMLVNGVALKDGEYYIYNAAGLKWVSEQVNTMDYYVNQAANIFDGTTVYLAADIDLKGEEFRPIGDYAFSRTSFNGVFDGQNHTISNFKVTEPVRWSEKVTEASYGLFGNVKGTIKNLTVKNVTVNPEGGRYSAALVGRLHNGGKIENCHVENSTVTINHWQVGGLVGQNNNGNIENCSVVGSTITGKAAVGAIVGMDMVAGEHAIKNCRVANTALVQNASFGADYDASYGLAVGLANASGIILNLENVVVENNTIKGAASNKLVGDAETGATIKINGSMSVSTAEELAAAIKAGGNYILLNDIAMTEATYQNVDFTLDGNGYTISQAEGSTNNYALFDSMTGKATFKNVKFAGIKGGAVIRTIGAELIMDNVTVENAETTQQQGLLRLMGKSTIKNSTFKNNTCSMVITLNYDGANNDPQVVENCVFEGNTCNSTAVVYYVKGASATINGNKFIENKVDTGTGNGATLYMGFQENCTITNNLFKNNEVTTSGTSKRVAGGLMIGYDATITGNAFIDNTVTGTNAKGNDVCASVYYTDIDLSGNYWGGNAPVENDDYFVEYPDRHSVIINDYLTTWGN